MAHHEACQLYIQQQIQEGLSEGKSPYSIGKELAAWVEKLFETSIPPNTLTRRAERAREKITTNVVNPTTTDNDSEIQEKLANQEVKLKSPLAGPGRPLKHEKPVEPYSCAMQMARIAISHLSRITKDDPKREEAFQEVKKWIDDNS
jgi:hypothetical protein